MGFIFGLMIGSMAGGGSTALPPVLGTIPFRCLAAFEASENDYRQCRSLSLRLELYDRTPCRTADISDPASTCSFDKHISWEILGLRELKKGIEQKRTER